MSFVGKVLIVVQVVMSICFMAFAGAVYVTQTNWKDKADGFQAQLADKDKLYNDLKTNTDIAKAEAEKSLADAQRDATKFENSARALTIERDDLKDRYNKGLTENETSRAQVAQAQTEARNRKQESDILRKQNIDLQLQIDTLQTNLASTKDLLFNRDTSLTKIQKLYDELLVDHGWLTTVVRKHGLSTNRLLVEAMKAAPPKIDSYIGRAEVDKTGRTDMVVIEIGSDDGIVAGHELHVFRPAKGNEPPLYLGMIRVEDVGPDRATCIVTKRAKTGNIEVGDNVTTQL